MIGRPAGGYGDDTILAVRSLVLRICDPCIIKSMSELVSRWYGAIGPEHTDQPIVRSAFSRGHPGRAARLPEQHSMVFLLPECHGTRFRPRGCLPPGGYRIFSPRDLECTDSSGDVSAILPSSNCALYDVGWLGSRAIVTKPEFARQMRRG